MRTLYLDCFAGAAGDMIVGALLNLVPSPSVLRDGLKKVTALAPEEYELVIEEGVKNGIAGINFEYSFDDTIHDRSITTDTDWIIMLGRGLDVFQPFGTDWLDLRLRQQYFRQVREFTIAYMRKK